MYKNNKILAIIPARGGSKGIKRKNIRMLAGKPLIAWTIEAARRSEYLDRVILSSEDPEIISVAKKYGCEVPFVRPRALAGDGTPGIDPVLHALNALPEKYDLIVLLQPTSPLRSAADIDGCIKQCVSGNHNSCVSITEPEKSPFWMFLADKNSRIKPLIKLGKTADRRQDLPRVYALNGAVYVARSSFILKKRTLVAEGTAGFVMPRERSIDIDSPLDLELAALLIKGKLKASG